MGIIEHVTEIGRISHVIIFAMGDHDWQRMRAFCGRMEDEIEGLRSELKEKSQKPES